MIWTEEDKKWLKANAHKYTRQQLVRLTGRTSSAINSKVHQYGLKPIPKTVVYSVFKVREAIRLRAKGHTFKEVEELAGLGARTASGMYYKHQMLQYLRGRASMGHKDQPYYLTEKDIEKALSLEYKPEDLTGEELNIYRTLN